VTAGVRRRWLAATAAYLITVPVYFACLWKWYWMGRAQFPDYRGSSNDWLENLLDTLISVLVRLWNNLALAHESARIIVFFLLCLIPAAYVYEQMGRAPAGRAILRWIPEFLFLLLLPSALPLWFHFNRPATSYSYYPSVPDAKLESESAALTRVEPHPGRIRFRSNYKQESADVRSLFARELHSFLLANGEHWDGEAYLVPYEPRRAFADAWWRWHSKAYRQSWWFMRDLWIQESMMDACERYFEAFQLKIAGVDENREQNCMEHPELRSCP
jgi:hypothetical protein